MTRSDRAREALVGFVGFVAMSAVAGLLVTVAVTPAIAVVGASASKSIGIFDALPEYLAIESLAEPSTIYAKNSSGDDVQLATFYSQNRLPVAFDQISQAVKDAAVAGEDPRFYTDGGVDIQGTVRGALSTALGHGVQGGSSITQQYVKNVLLQKCESMHVDTKAERLKYSACVKQSTGTTLDRKLREMRYAIGLEKKYSKSQILTGYLNIAGFGGTVYGIQAAAKYYYDLDASQLNPAQAASLIAIVNEPASLRLDTPDSKTNGASDGYAANKVRRDYILRKMLKYTKLSRAQFEQAIKAPIEPHITPSVRGCQTAGGAAYFCDYVQKIFLNDPSFGKDADARAANLKRGGYKIYTSLDMDLQQTAEDTLANWVPKTYDRADLGGALVGVQPGTGRVLYMAQNKDYSQDPDTLASGANYSPINFNTDFAYGGSSGFQVGSTYKVFTLAEWLAQGHSLQESVNGNFRTYSQSSFTDSCGGPWVGPYHPINDSPGEEGFRTPLSATAYSVNTAYVAMAHELDLCNIRKKAEAFQVHTATGAPLDTNPSSVLGTNTLAPLTMATAFAGIANNGKTCSPIAIDRIENGQGQNIPVPVSTCTQSVDPSIANAMEFALRTVTEYGTAAGMNTTGSDMLAKTGTTDGNEQLWLAAATTNVAGAYWVGNLQGHVDMRRIYPTHDTTPAIGRVSVMRTMMTAAVAKYGGNDFATPRASATRVSTITVPDFIGKDATQSLDTLTGLGFEAQDGGERDSAQPAGTVAASDPAAGSTVPTGSTVTLYRSNGHTSSTPMPTPTPTPTPAAAPGAGASDAVVRVGDSL